MADHLEPEESVATEPVQGFRTEPAAEARPFQAPAHPEMPCFESLTGFRVRREMRKRTFSKEEAEAAIWGLGLFNEDAAAKLRTEFRRAGVL